MIYGARISLIVGVVSVIMGLAMGGTIGAVAGAFGGRVDTVLMRIVDVLLAIPGILLAIGVVVWLDRGLPQIMFAVALTNLPVFARILRGSLLALQGADYVVAARSVGASTPRILFRHMLPNAVTPLIVAATLALATAIIDVAGLGFLGLGPADPRIAEWGTMLTGATSFYRQAPWIIFFTGVAISITRHRLQPPGRRAARVARSAAAPMKTIPSSADRATAPAATTPALLHVEDLLVRFRTHEGTVFAVNGISFDVRRASGSGSSANRAAARA